MREYGDERFSPSLIWCCMATGLIEGQLDASGVRIGIVAARFNDLFVQQLITGARDTFLRLGGRETDITTVRVPGSYELPLACRELAKSGRVDAIVALGVVIRGATTHYDLVVSAASSGLQQIMADTGIPLGFGVVTAEDLNQAMERCGSKAGNKGADATNAAIEMLHVVRQLRVSADTERRAANSFRG